MGIQPLKYNTMPHPVGAEDTDTGEKLVVTQYKDHVRYTTPKGNTKEMAMKGLVVKRQGRMVALMPSSGKGTQVPAALWSEFTKTDEFGYAWAKSRAFL